ncbi:hypothetical protein PSEMO_03850 [Pseudomonas putida]|uniref:Uncharacterized protein n=1 Tax=Pseudomonas putida TaxID=303 RepID=A0A1Q9RBB0_PSEPU|nr:hypothetical protein PSEMO_03850 [Pseudomonas putida]
MQSTTQRFNNQHLCLAIRECRSIDVHHDKAED